MIATTIDLYPFPVFLTEGGYIDGKGKIAGVFQSEEDARSEHADDKAIAILAWSDLTPDQQFVATGNSESMGN